MDWHELFTLLCEAVQLIFFFYLFSKIVFYCLRGISDHLSLFLFCLFWRHSLEIWHQITIIWKKIFGSHRWITYSWIKLFQKLSPRIKSNFCTVSASDKWKKRLHFFYFLFFLIESFTLKVPGNRIQILAFFHLLLFLFLISPSVSLSSISILFCSPLASYSSPCSVISYLPTVHLLQNTK